MEGKIKEAIANVSFLPVAHVILVIALVSSCKPGKTFEDYKKIEHAGWHQDSAVVFTFEITDATSHYNLYLNLRNYGNYDFMNIWLEVDICSSDSILVEPITQETILIPDSLSGSPIAFIDSTQVTVSDSIVCPDRFVESGIIGIVLSDPLGNWFGSGIGDLHDYQQPYKLDYLFPHPGEYKIKIKHKMKSRLLKGIRDVGISVEKKI